MEAHGPFGIRTLSFLLKLYPSRVNLVFNLMLEADREIDPHIAGRVLNPGWETIIVTAFIQARMSSRRFPGKVLTPFLGRPVIEHVIENVQLVEAISRTVVLTSDEKSDDPLVEYLESAQHEVFRGPLLNVFERYRLAAQEFPAPWVLRLCADSPLLSSAVVEEVVKRGLGDAECDLVTTRFSPPFPKGQNAELIRTQCMLEVSVESLTDFDREHVTPWFYRHRDKYRIVNASSLDLDLPDGDYTIDTPEDLERLESLFGGDH